MTDAELDHALDRYADLDDRRAILCLLFRTPQVTSPYGADPDDGAYRIPTEAARAVFDLCDGDRLGGLPRYDVRALLRQMARTP